MCAETARNVSEISPKKLRFRGFTYDLAREELRRGDRAVPLRPRASRALRLLVSRAGEIVSHDELRTAVWGDAIVEWQDGLHQIIRELRKALGDGSRNSVYIETLHRRGYRFCAAVGPARPPGRMSRIRSAVSARDFLLFGGGAVSIPVVVLLICAALNLPV
jgi:DNA-binding winged helix-turn-helix (wHTH) protein